MIIMISADLTLRLGVSAVNTRFGARIERGFS